MLARMWHNGHSSFIVAAAAAKSLQLCPTLCDPIDGSPPGSPVPGILQARTLECVAISFSNAWKWKVKVKSLSRVWPSATPWTAARQAPLSMGFSRQEYWSGVPLPSPPFTAKNSLKVVYTTYIYFLTTLWSDLWQLFFTETALQRFPVTFQVAETKCFSIWCPPYKS